MAGQRELLTYLPPVLLTMTIPQSIGSQTNIPLAEARIAGSTDPTFGTIGWTPRLDGQPFALVSAGKTTEKQYETGRVRTDSVVTVFLAIAEADVPQVAINLNDQAVAWRDALRATIPQHFMLLPNSDTLWPTAGDVRWILGPTDIKERHDILGVAFYGVECATVLSWSTIVQYQTAN